MAPRAERARLAGYRASFCARSTVEWGTHANPAPILALATGGSVRGMTLELDPQAVGDALGRWAECEGADLVIEAEAEVGLPFRRDPARVVFRTVDPSGPQALKQLPTDRLARMALVARGGRGTGLDYLKRLDAQMHEWGLEEPAAVALWKEVQKERGEAWR